MGQTDQGYAVKAHPGANAKGRTTGQSFVITVYCTKTRDPLTYRENDPSPDVHDL